MPFHVDFHIRVAGAARIVKRKLGATGIIRVHFAHTTRRSGKTVPRTYIFLEFKKGLQSESFIRAFPFVPLRTKLTGVYSQRLAVRRGHLSGVRGLQRPM